MNKKTSVDYMTSDFTATMSWELSTLEPMNFNNHELYDPKVDMKVEFKFNDGRPSFVKEFPLCMQCPAKSLSEVFSMAMTTAFTVMKIMEKELGYE